MLPALGEYLKQFWGPFRLLESNLVMMCLGALISALLVWYFLPKVWDHLPHDRGKALVADGTVSRGKPTGAGLVIVIAIMIMLLLIVPWTLRFLGILLCLTLIMLAGFFDDTSNNPWSESKKGIFDALVCLAAAACFSECIPVRIWIPFVADEITVSPWLYIPIAAFVLFICINTVNCSDGVDGVAASLAIMTMLYLGFFLYVVIGYNTVAAYLRVPHYGSGATWATMMFVSAGAFAGYLWHNANPSAVLMGDAGSRYLGLLIGIGTLATGNLFLVIVLAPILVINGGSGLLKLIILRLLKRCGCDVRPPLRSVKDPKDPSRYADAEAEKKQLFVVRMLHSVRFPLHDHLKRNRGWSNPQVMVRFMLLQSLFSPLVFILIIKLR